MWFHLYEVFEVVKHRNRKNDGCLELGEREVGSCCLMDTEFQFCKDERFWRSAMRIRFILCVC